MPDLLERLTRAAPEDEACHAAVQAIGLVQDSITLFRTGASQRQR